MERETPSLEQFFEMIRQHRHDDMRQALAQGVNPNDLLQIPGTNEGRSSLYEAFLARDKEAIILLIETGADFECCQNGIQTLLHLLASLKDNDREFARQVARFLMDRGVEVNTITPSTPATPLQAAILSGNTGLVHMLALHGAELPDNDHVNSVFHDRFNQMINHPFYVAALYGNIAEMMTCLESILHTMSDGDDSDRERDQNMLDYALALAAGQLQLQTVKLLVSYGAHPRRALKVLERIRVRFRNDEEQRPEAFEYEVIFDLLWDLQRAGIFRNLLLSRATQYAVLLGSFSILKNNKPR